VVPSPTERILHLAAYLDEHRDREVTLSDLSHDVAGYDDGAAPRDDHGRLLPDTREWAAIRKKLKRDLDDLRTGWGIEVVYDDNAHAYRLAPPFLTAEERAALIAAAAVVAVEGVERREPGAIGSGLDDGTARVVIHVHGAVSVLRDAIDARTPVRFRHEGRERVLEPWALGVWRNQWYVAGGDREHHGEMRRFRLDRIESLAPDGGIEVAGASGSYEIPDWFDTERAFDFDPNSWGHDPPLEARVRVEPDHVATFVAEFEGAVVEREAGGAAVVGLTVRHYESFRNRLLGFRGHAVVVAPPALVTLVRDHLAALAGSGDRERRAGGGDG
jgi:predicted DNA-binding transcriptional regulator YafY